MYPTNVISMVSCNAQRLDIWSPRKYGRNNLCHNICNLHYYVYFIMKNFKELNVVKRFILPGLAIIGSLFFTICGTGLYQLITTGKTNSLIDFLVFLVLFIILMLPSLFFYHKDGKKRLLMIKT